jgi:hypothetical protein
MACEGGPISITVSVSNGGEMRKLVYYTYLWVAFLPYVLLEGVGGLMVDGAHWLLDLNRKLFFELDVED